MKVLVFLTTVSLLVLACGGRVEEASCAYLGAGAVACQWDMPNQEPRQVCCPISHPYCGLSGSACGVGDCCATPP
jgi:hypothetical protein